MTPVVGEICYAVIMVDTALIARTHAMVQRWYSLVVVASGRRTRANAIYWRLLHLLFWEAFP
jgi:hypothetical protein